MNAKFQHALQTLEQQRMHIIDQVKNLSPEAYAQQPAPGKWSIAQILTHILTSERMTVGYMKKKSQGIDQLKDSGIVQSILLTLLKVSQRIPNIKYRAPRVIVANTPESLSFAELSKHWEAVRNELENFLESIEEKNARKLVFKHPFAGRLDARQAVIFMHEHLHHHWPQIKRLLNKNL